MSSHRTEPLAPTAAAGRTARIVSIQRWSIALLVAGGALNYVDRATLSVANKLIQEDLGIPVEKMGLLLSAFLWAYAFSQLPVGGLIDRFGPRRLLALGLFGWSAAQAAGGFVTNFTSFVTARFALGVGEAPLFPGGARVVRDWFGIRERGFATGLCQSASSLGNFIAVPLLTYLMLSLSWRWMFIIVGVLGVGLAGVWWLMYRDPSEVAITAEERRYLTEGDENTTTTRPPSFAEWRLLFAHRTTWGMIAGFFGNIYTLWLFTGWLPYYLEHERHMSIAKVGLVAAVPYFFGCVGAVCRRLAVRPADTPRLGPDERPQAADDHRPVRHLGLYGGHRAGDPERGRPGLHLGGPVPDLHRQQRRLGNGPGGRPGPVHRLTGGDAELRRLPGRSAGAGGYGLHRGAYGQLLSGALPERGHQPDGRRLLPAAGA